MCEQTWDNFGIGSILIERRLTRVPNNEADQRSQAALFADEAGQHRARRRWVTNLLPHRIDIHEGNCDECNLDIGSFPDE
eukprot:8267694-Pyramimonas_sp.AAC.1